jgi:hypothetical protein
MINLKKVGNNYKVLFNKKEIGTFELDVDGYYHFWDNPKVSGSWSSYPLRLIADELDKVNKPFDDSVKAYFEAEKLDKINKPFEDELDAWYRQIDAEAHNDRNNLNK